MSTNDQRAEETPASSSSRGLLLTLLVSTIALLFAWRGEREERVRIERAAANRKRPIYGRDAGLLAGWYFALRGEEEYDRAERDGRPLSLLLVEPAAGATSWATSEQIRQWLLAKARKSDLVGYLGNARYALLMPATEPARAARFAARLERAVPGVDVALNSLPNDGLTHAQLSAAFDKLGRAADRAA